MKIKNIQIAHIFIELTKKTKYGGKFMDLFKHVFNVIRIVTMKEYPLSEIKQQIRNKVIGPGDRIRVKGYLSCFAPICEPDTFVPKMITRSGRAHV